MAMLGNLGENLTKTMKKLVGMSVIDKKTIKEVVKEVKVPVEVPAKNPAFYVQYQSAEYTVAAITERVIADCNAKGHAVENPEALSIYLKPEDKKAYYTLGGFNGYIEL